MYSCIGYPESLQLWQLQFSVFVKSVHVSFSSVKEQAQCKTVLTKLTCYLFLGGEQNGRFRKHTVLTTKK